MVNQLGETATSHKINCHFSFGCEVSTDGSRQITFRVPDAAATDRDTEDCGRLSPRAQTVTRELPPPAPCHALCRGGKPLESLGRSAKSLLALPSTSPKFLSAKSAPSQPTLPPAPLDGRHRHTSEPLPQAVHHGARATDHLPDHLPDHLRGCAALCTAARAIELPSKLLHSRAAGRSHFGARLKARAAAAQQPADGSDANASSTKCHGCQQTSPRHGSELSSPESSFTKRHGSELSSPESSFMKRNGSELSSPESSFTKRHGSAPPDSVQFL